MGKHENRQYQQDIEDAVIDYLFNKTGNPIVASPGGTGKSFVMAKLTKRFVTEWPGTTVMILAQDAKLLRQNRKELERYWPNAPCGTYSSGLKQRDTFHPIIFAGIQSAAKKGHEFGKRNIILIDEADLVSPKDDALYNQLLTTLKETHPACRVVGFTASPFRLGTGCLTNLDLWDEICIDLTKTEKFNFFIDNGFLSPLVTKAPSQEIDVKSIAMKGNDFDEHSMQEVTDTDELNRAVVKDCIERGSDRKHWLVFSAGLKHGANLTQLFNSRGITTKQLSGKDTVEHRTEVENEWRQGKIRCLVNCGLYGRGFDFPAIDLIAIVRATQSVAWWIQACVRGTRTAEAKTDCMVLDYGGNIRRLGPVNDPIVPESRRKGQDVKGEAPIKICPQCFSYVPIQVKSCPDCGFTFPPPKTIEKSASSADIMVRKNKDNNPIIEDFYVLGIRYKPTISKTGKYYLRITYSVGTASFHEAMWFDHATGPTKRNLEKWWTYRGGLLPIPDGTDEAAERAPNELKIPTIIRVDLNKKYKEVVGCDFDPDAKIPDPEFEIWTSEKCTCHQGRPPCGYCESGDYIPF